MEPISIAHIHSVALRPYTEMHKKKKVSHLHSFVMDSGLATGVEAGAGEGACGPVL